MKTMKIVCTLFPALAALMLRGCEFTPKAQASKTAATGTPRSITVDMAKVSGAAHARRFNSTDGNYRAIYGSPFANNGSREFTTPGDNGTGTATYLTGSHPSNNLKDMGESSPPPEFDLAAYLDFLTRHGQNFVRL